jgi:NADH:ubiquinone oxidoreductase subunit E
MWNMRWDMWVDKTQIEEVAKVCRVSLHRVPRVADVEAEV